MTRKPAPKANDTPDQEKKGVRWSAEVSDHQKKPPPPAHKAVQAQSMEAASEQLAMALDAQNEPPTQEALIKLEDDWELTWPIWHMLPWMERKEIAQRHGYKSIGAFEEYMSLQKALGGEGTAAYSNELAYPQKKKEDSKKPAATTDVEEEEDDEDDTDTEDDDQRTTDSTEEEEEEEQDSDSPLLTCADEILSHIFSFLPVTLYGTKLAYVSLHPHWKRMTTSEPVLKQLCERVYLHQSAKKQLRVSKFHHSYRFMLYQRPRVQAGGGVYVLRFGRVKPIQRDMWTQVPWGAVLETVYYRYLYFEERGHCLYALSTIPPHDMLKRFHRVLLQSSQSHESPQALFGATKKKAPRKLLKGKEKESRAAELDTRVVWGTYTIQKNKVTVTAKQSWQTVEFGLRIVTQHNRPFQEMECLLKEKQECKLSPKQQPQELKSSSDEDRYVNGTDVPTTSPHGRFGVLQLETHRSSSSGNFEEHDTYLEQLEGNHNHPQVYQHSDVVNYTVEVDQVFRFLPDVRF